MGQGAPDRAWRLCPASQRRRPYAALDPTRFARLYRDYEQAKVREGVIDFEDILAKLAATLGQHPALAAQIQRRYAHFSVDEYQDSNPLQEAVLAAWLGQRQELCVVGDPEQTIYGFTGASSSYLTNFRRRFPRATIIKLEQNYRSTPQVITLANRLGGPPWRPGQLSAVRGDGPTPAFVAHDDAAAELVALTTDLTALVASGLSLSEMAVLVRLTAALPPIEAALSRARLPYRVWGEKFFARGEVKRVLVALHRAIAGGKGGTPAGAGLRALLGGIVGDAEESGVGNEASARAAAAEALLLIAAELGLDADVSRLSVELDRRAAEETDGEGVGVNLLTIHRAKGLEWEAVFLPGLEETNLPVRQALGSPTAIAEERRLAYVAVTRAKTHLWLSAARRRPTVAGNETARRVSRFVGALGLVDLAAERAASAADSRERKRAPRQRAAKAPAKGPAPSPTRNTHMGPGTGAVQGTAVRPDLFIEGDPLTDRLRAWRTTRARDAGVPAYVICPNATLAAIIAARPATLTALAVIKGMGPTRVESWGADVLRLLVTN